MVISSPPTLRAARTDELARLVAIDDDACTLFVDAGRDGVVPPWFEAAEVERWAAALARGAVVVAVTSDDEPIGFASLGDVDGDAHLQQLSVRRAWMRRGVGRALLEHAIHASRDRPLWLTTYDDIPWNRPMYERAGFVRVDLERCGPQIRTIIEAERGALPAPRTRVVMVNVARVR